MTLLGIHPDKLIDSLLTLSKEKDLHEGEFSLKVQDGESPGVVISLSIHAPERPVLLTPEREVPPEATTIRTFQTTSYFLRECHRQLFTDNQGKERELIISGASFEQDSHWLDILVAVKLKHASFGGVEADLADLFRHLAVADCNRNQLGLQSARFWDHIICLYRPAQDHIICL